MDKQNSHHSDMTWFMRNVTESQSTAMCTLQRQLPGTLDGKQNAGWRSGVLQTCPRLLGYVPVCVSDTAG